MPTFDCWLRERSKRAPERALLWLALLQKISSPGKNHVYCTSYMCRSKFNFQVIILPNSINKNFKKIKTHLKLKTVSGLRDSPDSLGSPQLPSQYCFAPPGQDSPESPELPSHDCFAPPPELLSLPDVWTMTIDFAKMNHHLRKKLKFLSKLYFEPANHVNVICHLTLTPLLIFLSWSGVFLHIAGKLWVHPPFGNSFEQMFNNF